MAIKGKRRPRGRRVVAAPPRPQLMVRRRPFWQRRWFWIALGVLAVAVIVVAVVLNARSKERETELARQLAAAQNVSGALQAEFPDDRTVVPPDLVVPFPTFRQTIDELASGAKKPAPAKETSEEVIRAATASAAAIIRIDTVRLVPARFALTRTKVNDAKLLFVQSFRLYADAAALTKTAADVQGAARQAILTSAGDVLSRASLLFEAGLRKLSGTVNGLGGTFQPAEAPQPTPSPSPSASPTESPSASPSA